MAATRSSPPGLGLKLADYVVTEAGFGADLGAEKFVDIKCRKSGLRPDACVIVATIRALKYHGGVDLKELNKENLPALEKGIANLARHVDNVRTQYGLPCVVSINHFTNDTEAEIALLKRKIATQDTPVVLARHWAQGGAGAEEVARTVVDIVEKKHPTSALHTRTPRPCGTRSGRSPRKSTAQRISPPTQR